MALAPQTSKHPDLHDVKFGWTLRSLRTSVAEKTNADLGGASAYVFPIFVAKKSNKPKSSETPKWFFELVVSTHLKDLLVKLDHFPNFRGENKT